LFVWFSTGRVSLMFRSSHLVPSMPPRSDISRSSVYLSTHMVSAPPSSRTGTTSLLMSSSSMGSPARRLAVSSGRTRGWRGSSEGVVRGRSRLSLLGLLILITLLSGGCRSWRPDPPPPSSAFGSAGRRLDTPPDRVIVVSIDGLRPDAISRYGLPTLSHLVECGAYSLEARTI